VPHVTSGIINSLQVINGSNYETVNLRTAGNAASQTITITGHVRMNAYSIPIVSEIYIFDTTDNDSIKNTLETYGYSIVRSFAPSTSFENNVESIVGNMSGDKIPINLSVKSDIDRIKEINGIGNLKNVTITTTKTAYIDSPNDPTQIYINGYQGDNIKIKVSGSSLSNNTTITAFLNYTDSSRETKNNIPRNTDNIFSLTNDLTYIGFYITNLAIGQILSIDVETIPIEGMLTDISQNKKDITKLQNEKADVGIAVLNYGDYVLENGRINSTNGSIAEPSSFKHIVLNLANTNIIEFIPASQGLSPTYGYAFYDENGNYVSGKGFLSAEQNVKTIINVPPNAKTWKYGFYNPQWNDTKYNTFICYDTELTIYGIQNQINKLIGSDLNVVCFGDSMTQGNQDSTGNTYPKYLGELLGLAVYNAGVGGEDTLQIASRQGGIHLMAEPFTIPATTDAVAVTLSCLEHDYTDPFYIISQANGGINPVEIAGVVGTLTFTGNLATQTYTYTFARNIVGDAVALTRPEPVITYTSKMRDYIQIFWVGTNDTPCSLDTVKDKIVPRIDAMIAWTNAKNYLVIGLTAKSRFSDLVDCNTYMQRHFGTRFIDISKYILQYGLQDESITPTSQDTTDIINGEIPSSLRVDAIHMNKNGYHIVANQVYKRGQLLGYWG
jgi:lysophospholipase L1-like esterase